MTDDRAVAGETPAGATVAQGASGWGLAAVCVGIAASVIPGFLLGSLFVTMGPELGYDEATSGMLVAAFFSASAFLSAPLGRWVDRRGPAVCLRLALACSAALQFAIAGLGRSVASIAALALAAGAANSLNQLAANVWIARFVPARRQGIAFAAKQSSMPAAALVAGFSLPVLVERFGWESAFVTGAGLAILALVLLGGLADERHGFASSAVEHPSSDRPERVALGALAVAAALSAAAAVTLGSFYVNSAVDVGFSPGTAGTLLAVGSAISIASRLIAGGLADRRDGTLLGIVAGMLALGAVSYLMLAGRQPWTHVLALPLAFGAGWAWPGVFNLSVVRAHQDRPGRATGITQSGTYVGASVGPLIFGVIAEEWSYSAGWVVAAVVAAGAAAAVMVARAFLERRVPG